MKLALGIILLAATFVAPQSFAQEKVTVTDAWVLATVPQQKAMGVFMKIEAAKDTKLISASSPITPDVEVHEMTMQEGVMRMRQIPAVDVPAGKAVELKPGGYHVMLLDLKRQVNQGDTVPLSLAFENKDGTRENVNVEAMVRPLNASGSPSAKIGDSHLPR